VLLHREESYIIRGVAFDVYKALGHAHKEKIYQNAMTLGLLRCSALSIERERRIPVHYAGKQVGVYIPDIVVNQKILLELKAKPLLLKEDLRQFWEYLKGSEYRLGFLINFGDPRGVKIARRVYDTARNQLSP